jgi:hypothetical protein
MVISLCRPFFEIYSLEYIWSTDNHLHQIQLGAKVCMYFHRSASHSVHFTGGAGGVNVMHGSGTNIDAGLTL